MIKHEFKIKEIHNKNKTRVRKRITVTFEENGYELLGVFLTSEIKNFYDEIVPVIEAVSDGRNENEEEFTGNRCRLKVGAENAFLTDENDEDELPPVEIPTQDLLEMIREWKMEKDRIKDRNKG